MKEVKTVYIVRHAKSSWDTPELTDHDRPLLDIGIKKTKKIIDFLVSRKVVPETIISSSAVRARDTAKLIAEGIGFDSNSITNSKELYYADPEDIYSELFLLRNSIKSVMLVGHNPTLTDFVNDFMKHEIDNFPTSAVCCVEFNTKEWESISNAKHNVKFVVYPSMLK